MAIQLVDYIERNATILSICKGREVLHLGCVGFTDCPIEEKLRLANASLHARITEISTGVGVDLDAASINQLRERNVFKNVIAGNVERLSEIADQLGKFDVVLAGDIIEHLSNPGEMLEGIKPHLKPGALLVISTPNTFSLPSFLRYLGGCFHEGLQHVLSFSPFTLAQLLERHGFKISEAYSCYQLGSKLRYGALFSLGNAFFRRFPKLGGTLLFTCKLSEP